MSALPLNATLESVADTGADTGAASEVAPARRRPRSRTFHPLRVAAIEHLCDDAAAVTFDVPANLADEFAFRPGESVTLRRMIDGQEERRDYSICAPAGAPLRVGVREVPDGLFSQWLVHDVRPGDVIEVQPPSGTFVADPAAGGRHVLVAAGSGITPVLSIAASLLANPESRVTLIYGNRRAATVMFAEELADLKDRYRDRFDLIHVLSREPRDVELFSGRLEPDRLRSILDLLVPMDLIDHVWLCGPYEMVVAARSLLADLGVPAERVHVELFYVDAPPPPVRHVDPGVEGPSSRVTVVLDGRSSTIEIARDARILDSAQRSRADLPFACKGGVCGTCRAHLVSGKVDMVRNYALEDAEIAAGFVLTCQSYPVSDELTVDYDA